MKGFDNVTATNGPCTKKIKIGEREGGFREDKTDSRLIKSIEIINWKLLLLYIMSSLLYLQYNVIIKLNSNLYNYLKLNPTYYSHELLIS